MCYPDDVLLVMFSFVLGDDVKKKKNREGTFELMVRVNSTLIWSLTK